MSIPCPFVYANGKVCTGHIIRIEAYKADVQWELDKQGEWEFAFSPRSHYHLYCSEKGSHSGWKQEDDSRMKFYLNELPDEVTAIMYRTEVRKNI